MDPSDWDPVQRTRRTGVSASGIDYTAPHGAAFRSFHWNPNPVDEEFAYHSPAGMTYRFIDEAFPEGALDQIATPGLSKSQPSPGDTWLNIEFNFEL